MFGTSQRMPQQTRMARHSVGFRCLGGLKPTNREMRTYLLNVILAISAISAPVGPHASLLVATPSQSYSQQTNHDIDLPLRTFTCTELYPFVTFLMLRRAPDMFTGDGWDERRAAHGVS